MRYAVIALAAFCLAAALASAGQPNVQAQLPVEGSAELAALAKANPKAVADYLQTLQLLAWSTLVLTAGLLLAELVVMRLDGTTWGDPWASRVFLGTLVIGLSSFLTVVGYSQQQLAPLYGIFGVVIGFLFGRADGAKKKPLADAEIVSLVRQWQKETSERERAQALLKAMAEARAPSPPQA